MARKRKEVEEVIEGVDEVEAVEAVEEAPVTSEEAFAEPVADATEATVTYRGGSRTYTQALHGDNFIALAQQFAGKDTVRGVVTTK